MKILAIDTSSKFLNIALAISKTESLRYGCRGFGGLQAIPQGVTGSNCDEKEQLGAPEGRSPYGQDSARTKASAYLVEDNFIIAEESHLLDRQHSALLVPKVKELLEKCNSNIGDIDAFVVGLGPGSFTGLRIGVSSVKGFGIATKKPCVGVASIDALAMNADVEKATVVPVIDAKRGQVYSAIYKRKKNGSIFKTSGYLLLTIDALMKKIKGTAVFLGDGISLYKEKIRRLGRNAIFLDEEYWYPKAGSLIKLGLKNIKRHRKQDLGKLKPLYIYSKYCQVRTGSKP